MRDKVLVGFHADDSSDDESSSHISRYALSAEVDGGPVNWSRFNFLLGVHCLYQQNVSDVYYPQKTALGDSTWPADKLKAWLTDAVAALAKNILYHGSYQVESEKLFRSFQTHHSAEMNSVVRDLFKNPRALAWQLRDRELSSVAIHTSLTPLRARLAEFVAGITEADVAAAGAQPLRFSDISYVAEFRSLIMQEVSRFLRSAGLMRENGNVALKADRLRNVARLERAILNGWQAECFKIVKRWDHANTNLQSKLDNHRSEIVEAWLRVAFTDLQPRGVVATDNPAVFLIPVGFDFSQGPFSSLFAAKPANFTNVFAKAALLRASFNARLAEDFERSAVEIFQRVYRKQGLKLQRPAFKLEFQLKGVVSWLASLRLAIRLKRRVQRSALEAGDGEHVHAKHTAVTWHLLRGDPTRDYAVLEQQSLTSLASQADLLPDLGSYATIAKQLKSVLQNFNQAHSAFTLTDRNVASIIMCLLQKNRFLGFRKNELRLDLASSDDFSSIALKKFIAALTCLLFVIEVQRHPAALVMHVLMLDLIKDGKMTFEGAFTEEMPMAMEGAVAVARHIQAEHRDASFHPYSYPGASKRSLELGAKESALVGKWLGVFAVKATNDREKMTAVYERVQAFCAG